MTLHMLKTLSVNLIVCTGNLWIYKKNEGLTLESSGALMDCCFSFQLSFLLLNQLLLQWQHTKNRQWLTFICTSLRCLWAMPILLSLPAAAQASHSQTPLSEHMRVSITRSQTWIYIFFYKEKWCMKLIYVQRNHAVTKGAGYSVVLFCKNLEYLHDKSCANIKTMLYSFKCNVHWNKWPLFCPDIVSPHHWSS